MPIQLVLACYPFVTTHIAHCQSSTYVHVQYVYIVRSCLQTLSIGDAQQAGLPIGQQQQHALVAASHGGDPAAELHD